jgi:hypothetical protein
MMNDRASAFWQDFEDDLEDGLEAATWTVRVILGTAMRTRVDPTTLRHLNEEAFGLFKAQLAIARDARTLDSDRMEQMLKEARDLIIRYEKVLEPGQGLSN